MSKANMLLLTEDGLERTPVKVLRNGHAVTVVELLEDVPLLKWAKGETRRVPEWAIE